MKLNKLFGIALLAISFSLCLVACEQMSTPDENTNPAAAAGGSGNGPSAVTPATFSISNLRVAADVDGVSESNKGNWNKSVEAGEVVVAFTSGAETPITSITASFNGQSAINASFVTKLTGTDIVNDGQLCMFNIELEAGTWVIVLEAEAEGGGTSASELGGTVELIAKASIGNQQPAEPEISNFRWNTTGNVKTSDKAEWNPTTFQTGSRLWFGLDSNMVAESVTFILNKNGKEERKNLTPKNHAGFVGLGTNGGFIWAMYPETMDFAGDAKIRVEVHYAGGITKTTQEGAFKVVDMSAPPVDNVRWGPTKESVMASQKANWNKPLIEHQNLFVGLDTEASKVVAARFRLARSDNKDGKHNLNTYYKYADLGDYKDWGKFDNKSLWFQFNYDLLCCPGEALIAITLKFQNGAIREVYATAPVERANYISNVRFGPAKDGLKINNKANWNKPLKMGQPLYVAFDISDSEVDTIKYMFAKNDAEGKNKNAFGVLSGHGSYKDWGVLEGKTIWTKHIGEPTDFVGEARFSIEVKFKNGVYSWADGGAPVQEMGNIRKLTYEQTGLPNKIKPNRNYEYYEYGVFPQTLKAGNVTIVGGPNANGYYNGSDGELYARVNGASTYQNKTYYTPTGQQIWTGGDFYFKVEPIIWQRIPGTNKLMSTKILDQRIFYGDATIYRVDAIDWKPAVTGVRHQSPAWWDMRKICTSNYYFSDIRAWLNGTENRSRFYNNIAGCYVAARIQWLYAHGDQYTIFDTYNYAIKETRHTGHDHDWRGNSNAFINRAFNAAQRDKLQPQLVSTSKRDDHMDNQRRDFDLKREDMLWIEDGYDKVWLWSKQEISRQDWGFPTSNTSGDLTNRKKPITDYAMARGTSNNGDTSTRESYGWWWLRSPDWNDGGIAQAVDPNGYAQSGTVYARVDRPYHGVVPGIALPADMLK